MSIQPRLQKSHTAPFIRLAPPLAAALRELATIEGLSLPTLITVLLLEALRARSRRPS